MREAERSMKKLIAELFRVGLTAMAHGGRQILKQVERTQAACQGLSWAGWWPIHNGRLSEDFGLGLKNILHTNLVAIQKDEAGLVEMGTGQQRVSPIRICRRLAGLFCRPGDGREPG